MPVEGYLEASGEGPVSLRDVEWVELSAKRVRGGMAGRSRQMMDIEDDIVSALRGTSATWELGEGSWSLEGIFDEEAVRVFRVLNPFCSTPTLLS
jgi:hypothetical protein